MILGKKVWLTVVEDEKLATILRDYVPFGLELPGVRANTTHQPWPSPEKKIATLNYGGDFLSHHKFLLRAYATPWLLAVHDQDAAFYGKTCFELVVEIAEDTPSAEVGEGPASSVSISTVYRIDCSEGGFIIALYNQTLPSVCRLHHV